MNCKICGSYAINEHLHGRDGSDSDLCDVCYWRKRAETLSDHLGLLPVSGEGEKKSAPSKSISVKPLPWKIRVDDGMCTYDYVLLARNDVSSFDVAKAAANVLGAEMVEGEYVTPTPVQIEPRVKVLVDRIERHLAVLGPHQRERTTADLLARALAALKKQTK